MALSKSKSLKRFDVNGSNLTVSIAYDIIITDSVDGEVARQEFRGSFASGEVELVKTFTGISNNQNPYIVFLNSLWV